MSQQLLKSRLRPTYFRPLEMPPAGELQHMHDMLRGLRILNGRLAISSDGGLVIECGEIEDYAFKVVASGAHTVRITAGNAYMVNETPRAYADDELELDIPEAIGTYIVGIVHTYGFGSAEGSWGDLTVYTNSMPAESDAGRIVKRNFILATVSVDAAGNISGVVQNWKLGDVWGYAPYFAPEEGPAP